MMVKADDVLTALTVAAGVSLGVERSLELLKHFMDLANGSLNADERSAPLKQAEEAIAKAEAALKADPGDAVAPKPLPAAGRAPQAAGPARSVADSEASEKYPPPQIPLIPMAALLTQDTANTLFFQFAAAGLGILAAWAFDLQLLHVLARPDNAHAFFPVVDKIFTGLVIGGGSQPIHVLIRFLSERKITVEAAQAAEGEGEVEKTKALAKVITSRSLVTEAKEEQPFAWVDVVYTGGVSPGELENVHKRSGPPNLIVYHHTAMSSVSSFQAVIDEFRISKKWITGYHCVIMPDGAIKPFCRWDRYGNHAQGLNDRSLGIAFHGNFHTKADDKFSNADGRYGNQKPTEAQLHAGARVISLWVSLYPDIKLDFEHSILPHREAMPRHTVCPGSNFPIDPFKTLITQYHDAWSHSQAALDGVAAFRKLALVYA
ncbi:MAG TPA: peptidoglycan recognition family protein [Burkholderiales bacterium]|nr:peptidoglycan recognition family protein [Burkholderiales bacterium]